MQLEKLNSQGGLILILSVMWMFTLVLIMGFGVWVLKTGVSPTNQIVTTLLGVLVGTAFGSVNGALFTSMNGSTPPADTVRTITSTTVTSPATLTADPTSPLGLKNNPSQATQTQPRPSVVSENMPSPNIKVTIPASKLVNNPVTKTWP